MTTASTSHHQNHIPAAVRANAEKAEALAKQFAEAKNAPPAQEPPAQEPPAPPAQEPPVTQQGNDQQFTQEPPAPTPQDPPRADDWEQKFRSEQGRNKALREQNSDLIRENASLTAELTTLRERMASGDSHFGKGASLITPEELAEYGEDFMTVVEKKAREIAQPLIEEVTDLRARVDGVTTQNKVSAKQRMFATLDSTHPNWREINSNETFIDWLANTEEELTGQSFKSLLDSHVARNDAARVGRIITRFQQEHPAFAPQSTQQPVKDPLADLAAPGRARTAGTPVTAGQGAEKPIFKASDLTQFSSDVVRGKYRGRPEEEQRIRAMLDDAVREGRIQR